MNTIVTTKIDKRNGSFSEYSAQNASPVTLSPLNSSSDEIASKEGARRQGPRLARDAPAGPPLAPLGSHRIIGENSKNEERKIVYAFQNYLKITARTKFIIHSMSSNCYTEPHHVSSEIGYIHRWTAVYRKSVIAKMYLLDKWHKEHPCAATMGTFTTYQDGKYSEKIVGRKTIMEAFRLLKRSWDYVRRALKYYAPGLEFVGFYEPHKSGYPHLHVLFFGDISSKLEHKIKLLWSD